MAQTPNQALQQTAGHDSVFLTIACRCPAAAELGRSAVEAIASERRMPRATVLVVLDRPGEWELAEAWIERWRDRMAVCPDEPGGCLCCVAWWDVDAPQEALAELPAALLAGSEWASGSPRDAEPGAAPDPAGT